jgi:Lipocalin-like domain
MSMMKWFAALALVLLLVQPCIAGDLAPIVGIWKLVSFEREYQTGGEREYPMGKAPTGYILFLPEGRMTVVITGEGRKAPTTDQDRVGLFNSMVAYTGRYRVDGDK